MRAWLLILSLLVAAPASAQTGLPFTDDFEGTLSGWPNSSVGYTINSVRSVSPTDSVRATSVNEANSSGQLNRAWGDAKSQCTSCFDCNVTTECPGTATPDIWVQFQVYVDESGQNWTQGEDRKIAQLCIFEDWSAGHGSNLSHCVTYISILYLDHDGDGAADDIAMNSFRRHDAAGDPQADEANAAGTVANSAFSVNTWHQITIHATTNTPASSDGVFEMWVDQTQTHDSANVDWFGGYNGGLTWNMLLLTDNGNGPNTPETIRMYWDDVEISTASLDPTQVASSTIGPGVTLGPGVSFP